jgi:hypothetical protein
MEAPLKLVFYNDGEHDVVRLEKDEYFAQLQAEIKNNTDVTVNTINLTTDKVKVLGKEIPVFSHLGNDIISCHFNKKGDIKDSYVDYNNYPISKIKEKITHFGKQAQ